MEALLRVKVAEALKVLYNVEVEPGALYLVRQTRNLKVISHSLFFLI
jgi:hypothetical protein